MRVALIVAAIICLIPHARAAGPDQVLVLYNADYTIDQDGSEPGQDSREVAEYYVRRHTDPATGRKPHILGLRCRHGKDHLNTYRLPEESKDNYFGLEYTAAGQPPRVWPAVDSRHVDFLIGKNQARKLDLRSVIIALGKDPDRAAATVVYKERKSTTTLRVRHTTTNGDQHWQLNAQIFSRGIVHVWLEAKDKQGRDAKNLHRVYRDFDNFKVSTTGFDGIRDDKNYLEDIERPVKDFLQDLNNALPDGSLLKDHIVYIVVCHGLPKAVESLYGICRGGSDLLSNYGDGSSLQQRLMMLYFDVTAMNFDYITTPTGLRKRVFAGGARPRFLSYSNPLRRDADGVRRWMICNSLAFTLAGRFNPYQHPKLYRIGNSAKLTGIYDQKKYRDPDNRLEPLYADGQTPPLPFSPQLRKAWPWQSFLYWAMRIDGPTPSIAKGQIDAAIYGGRYLTPKLGKCYNRLAGPQPIQPSVRLGIDELKDLGFSLQPTLNRPTKVVDRPLIFSAHFGNGPRYYDEGRIVGWNGVLPGGIIYAIKSSNGWERDADQFATYFEKMIQAGATVTAGLGARGSAHITSASWWDDPILFYHLFRGYQLGECLLMSTYYLDWVTAYIGDPLYRPNVLENKPDSTPPIIEKQAIVAEILPAKDSYCALVTVPLRQSPANPEMAEISAVYSAPGQPEQTAQSWRFSVGPRVILCDLKPSAAYRYTVTLTDPYGNASQAEGSLTVPAEEPSKLRHEETIDPGKKAKPIAIARRWKKGNPPILISDAGEVEIEFTPLEKEFTLLTVKGLTWTSEKFIVGGGTARTHRPLKFETGRRYRIVARWRRRPVTREVYLIAPDGTEFLAAANNYTPWAAKLQIYGTARFGDRAGAIRIHAVKIFDNANPAPDEHRHPYVKKFRMAEFEAAR